MVGGNEKGDGVGKGVGGEATGDGVLFEHHEGFVFSE